LSGAGGHGLIQAARILAEAAAVYDNKNAAESCSYGPEARGNASRAEIVISDEAIDCPKIKSIDLLMALTQEAFGKNIKDLKANGIVVIDDHVKTGDEVKGKILYSVDFVKIAEAEFGKPSMVNIIALGFLAGICDVIDIRSIRQAMLARVPRMSEEFYTTAFETGLQVADVGFKKSET
jgi:2-oxoglutarate ferredoxin oxidoreductase subunit gamma